MRAAEHPAFEVGPGKRARVLNADEWRKTLVCARRQEPNAPEARWPSVLDEHEASIAGSAHRAITVSLQVGTIERLPCPTAASARDGGRQTTARSCVRTILGSGRLSRGTTGLPYRVLGYIPPAPIEHHPRDARRGQDLGDRRHRRAEGASRLLDVYDVLVAVEPVPGIRRANHKTALVALRSAPYPAGHRSGRRASARQPRDLHCRVPHRRCA